MSIGARVKEWREKREMSVETLARLVGLKPTTIYDLERGDSQSTKKLHRIATALKINVDWLERNVGVPEGQHTLRDPIPLAGGWPFDFDRVRFDRLQKKQRGRIEKLVLQQIEFLEEDSAQHKSKRRAG